MTTPIERSPRPGRTRSGARFHLAMNGPILALALALAPRGALGADPPRAPASARAAQPFVGFNLPDAWEARFWATPEVKALLALEPKALAAVVPEQAGLRFCRCPGCGAGERDEPLAWSFARPAVLTCRKCGLTVPNDTIPAKVDNKVPEEAIEVLPGTLHKYSYHTVEPERQAYPGERLYLTARRDYACREWLAKAALYAAVRYREQPPTSRDPALARLACVLLLRFAQVYPAYAIHYDQPGEPKYLQRADLPPPYRRGYRSAKWDWLGCLDVPLNLVVAYALLRDDPALIEAGRALGDPHPKRTIERNLFRASAEFVLRQPDEGREESAYAHRGLLAVGRLLDDAELTREAAARLAAFGERGFYHDGLWRDGDAAGQRRVLALLDGWIDRLLAGSPTGPMPMLSLARSAGGVVLTDPNAPEVQQAAWPAPAFRTPTRQPALLGGAGIARLALGEAKTALDVELRGLGNLGGPQHFNRLSLRVWAGGRPVVGDLDDLPPSPDGWERSTASHNTVVIDGLNQRETPGKAREPAPGSDILFFAADPDFQVTTFEDRRAYPRSATRYRHTLIASAGPRSRYAVSVFEVHGGLQHDQLFHAPAGSQKAWRTSLPLSPGPASLLAPGVSFVPQARAQDGRWFVQAYGELDKLAQARAERPALAWLDGAVRLHLLGDTPMTVITATVPDPLAADGESRRGALVLRRRSADGSTLKTTFVTAFEPLGMSSFRRVARVGSQPETVVLAFETDDGTEHLVVNLTPGTEQSVRLADGQALTTDGLAVRLSSSGLVLAGGTYAATASSTVRQSSAVGTIVRAGREFSENSRGWFETEGPLTDLESLAGRALLIRHGDATVRGWTIVKAVPMPDGRTRLQVREEPGFTIDSVDGPAQRYQFPGGVAPPPHRFRVSKLAR